MPSPTQTTTQIAFRIADGFQLDQNGKTRVGRILRNIASQGIVPSKPDPADARGTRGLEEKAACVAALLWPLAELGIDARGHREAANFMLRGPIDDAIKATRAGQKVKFLYELARGRKSESADDFFRRFGFEIDGVAAPASAAEEIFDDWSGVTRFISVPIPASVILHHVLMAN